MVGLTNQLFACVADLEVAIQEGGEQHRTLRIVALPELGPLLQVLFGAGTRLGQVPAGRLLLFGQGAVAAQELAAWSKLEQDPPAFSMRGLVGHSAAG